MSKQEVSALIQAIQETASFLLKQGITGRPKIIVKEYDDIYVDGIVVDYSNDIEDIIENIPDDPEPTPTDSFVYGGNFTLNESISAETVDGGYGRLNKIGTRTLVDLIGWSGGGNLNLAYSSRPPWSNSELDPEETYDLFDELGNYITYYDPDADYEIIYATRNGVWNELPWSAEDLEWLSLIKDNGKLKLQTGQGYPSSDEFLYSLMYKKTT